MAVGWNNLVEEDCPWQSKCFDLSIDYVISIDVID
jgi:hypothetical protein